MFDINVSFYKCYVKFNLFFEEIRENITFLFFYKEMLLKIFLLAN